MAKCRWIYQDSDPTIPIWRPKPLGLLESKKMWIYERILTIVRNITFNLVAKGLRVEKYCDKKCRIYRAIRDIRKSMCKEL